MGEIAGGRRPRKSAARTLGSASQAYLVQDIGQRQASAGCLIKLGQICTDLGEYAEAHQNLKKALTITADPADHTQKVEASRVLITPLTEMGDKVRAAKLAMLIERDTLADASAQCRQIADILDNTLCC